MTKRARRAIIAAASVFTAVVFALLAAVVGFYCRHPYKQWTPDYEMTDIGYIIEKDRSELTDEDYALLYAQTGVTRAGVNATFEAGRQRVLLSVQRDYFSEREILTDNFTFLTCMHEMEQTVAHIPLENGDVLISNSTHFSAFMIGHSAIVVDAEQGRLFESAGYGDNGVSQTDEITSFTNRPAFLILRPKLDKEKREEIAEYAATQLSGVYYDFFVGVFSKKYPEKIKKTHCAHIIWYAFKHFGYDIDSNGGGVVTPKNIANSDMFEVLQVYGFDPETLWS